MDQVHQAAGLPLVRKTVFVTAEDSGNDVFFDMGLKGKG